MGAAGCRFARFEFVATRRPRRRGRRHARVAGHLELAAERRFGGNSFVGTVRRRVDGTQARTRRLVIERRATERRSVGTAAGTPWLRAAGRPPPVLVARGARSERACRT